MYDHFDEFKLILCRAEGTGYADFIEVLVELEVDRSEEYYSHLRKNGMLSGSMTRQLHHMITRAYFTAVCETIVHDVPREEAMKYVDELAIFFHSGWYALATVPLSAAIYFAWLMRSILVGRGFQCHGFTDRLLQPVCIPTHIGCRGGSRTRIVRRMKPLPCR